MDFIIEEKELDLSIMESCNLIEESVSKFLICVAENSQNEFIMEASLESFKQKTLQIIEKILEALKKFFKDVKIQIEVQIQKVQLNKKLEELKDLMAKKRSKVVNKKIKYFDVKKYKQYYSDFINRYTSELIRGLNKDFKSVEEYEKWQTDMLNKLADFNYKLSDEEQWKLSVTINSAVKLTEEEVKNRDKNLKMVEDEGSESIKGLQRYYKKIDTEKSFVNYNNKKIHIFRLQNSFIGLICSKIMQCIKTIIRFITKHTFACVTTLIVFLIAS